MARRTRVTPPRRKLKPTQALTPVQLERGQQVVDVYNKFLQIHVGRANAEMISATLTVAYFQCEANDIADGALQHAREAE